jgi:hypothetical protein
MLAEAVIMLLTYIPEAPGSNLGHDTHYPEIFRDFPRSVTVGKGKKVKLIKKYAMKTDGRLRA